MGTNLGPQFHGTGADLHPGDRVLPSAKSGVKSVYSGMTTRGEPVENYAFSTTDENTAWKYAHTAMHTNPGPAQRSSVLRVHPHPDQRPGDFHESRSAGGVSSIPGETVAPHYDIAERIDIMPGRQGTFPINWYQFAARGGETSRPFDVINHPTDTHIAEGHDGGQMWRDSRAKKFGLEELEAEPDHELASDKKQGRLW